MEPEGLTPHSQEPALNPYPEPHRSSPCPPSHFCKIDFNIILPNNAWVFRVVSSPQVSLPKPCMHLSSPPYVLYTLPISVFFTWSTE